MEVKVLDIRLMPMGRPVRAYVDIKLDNWILYDWRIIKRDGERAFVSVPQTSWKDQNGKVKYRALLSIPGELKQRIEIAILSAWEMEQKNVSPRTD